MKFSVATRIFLAFVAAIIALGASSAYTVVRMTDLRASVTLVLDDIMPLADRLRRLSNGLRAREDYLGVNRASDTFWVPRLLPSLAAFQELRRIETRLLAILNDPALTAIDRVELERVTARLSGFRSSHVLAEIMRVEGVEGADTEGLLANGDNADVYRWLIRRMGRLAREGRLTETSPEARAAGRMFRQIDRAVVDAARGVSTPIQALGQRARDQEQSAVFAVVGTTIGALIISIILLFLTQLTLAPIRHLREGVRRLAAGETHTELSVRSKDEIGELAREFDRMAEALRARDATLARQREALSRADRLATLGKMAAQITHEVRNPLLSIGLNTELIAEEIEALLPAAPSDQRPEVLELVDAVQAEVHRLKSITEQYLRYARLPRPERETLDLGVLTDQFLTFLTPELDAAQVTLRRPTIPRANDPGAPMATPVFVDRDQMRQVLLNIARNAMEAMDDQAEGRQMTVTLNPGTGGRGGVILSLSDTGPGVDPELRDRIFEPFVTGRDGGTGLGLSLAAQIVQEHEGSLSVETPLNPTGGTCFSIWLPLEDLVAAPKIGRS